MHPDVSYDERCDLAIALLEAHTVLRRSGKIGITIRLELRRSHAYYAVPIDEAPLSLGVLVQLFESAHSTERIHASLARYTSLTLTYRLARRASHCSPLETSLSFYTLCYALIRLATVATSICSNHSHSSGPSEDGLSRILKAAVALSAQARSSERYLRFFDAQVQLSVSFVGLMRGREYLSPLRPLRCVIYPRI